MPKDDCDPQARIAMALQAVLIVAGFDRQESKMRIDKFAEGIGRIVRTTLELKQLIGEHITSADFEVYVIRPGEPFDPHSMKNIEPVSQHARVLCTTALGLTREEGKPNPRKDTVIKTEVLVDDILNDLRTDRK
jgi:hypothetical protein